MADKTSHPSKLTTALVAIQTKRQLTDSAMAQILGCTRQLYQMTRTSRILPGKKIITGALVAFPELEAEIIYFLSTKGDKVTEQGDKNSPQLHGGAQGSPCKRFLGELVGRIKKALKND